MKWMSAALVVAAVAAAAPACGASTGGHGARRPAPAPSDSLKDLPLVELAPQGAPSPLMAVVLTGDGGWADIDRKIGQTLAGEGVAVVGFDMRRYLWTKRTPDEAGRDLDRILGHYLAAWGKQRALVIGYSRGADVAPFMVSRLPDAERRRVRLLALIGASHSANFKFHLEDLVSDHKRRDDLPVVPEIERLRELSTLCFYGTEEKESACTDVHQPTVRVIPLHGGHHLDGDYVGMARTILEAAKAP